MSFNTPEELAILIKEADSKAFDYNLDAYQCNQANDGQGSIDSYEKGKYWTSKKEQLEREYLNLTIYSK